MVKQVLPPRVKDGKETNLRSKMFGIGGNSQHRVGRGSEEDAIDDALVLQGNVGNLFRHGKDDMKVLGLEKFRLPVFNPLGAGQRLTFRTVTIRTRNGEISITCFMGSISLWGVGRLNDAHSKGRTRVQLTIKIWRTLPSKAQSVCPAAGMNLFGGAAERQPQWPRVFQLDLPECRFR